MSTPLSGDLYARFEPWHEVDARYNHDLRTYLEAIAAPLDEVDEIVRDTDEGNGWTIALDATRAPAAVLPWLAQFDGTVLVEGFTEQQWRDQIIQPGMMERGTPEFVQERLRQTLTGSGFIAYYERYAGDAYHLYVVTLTSETPDPALSERVLRNSIPAGLLLTFEQVTGQTWATLVGGHADWNEVVSTYSDWADVIAAAPTPSS